MRARVVEARDHIRAAARAIVGQVAGSGEPPGAWRWYPIKGTKLGIHAQKSIPELWRDIEAARDLGAPLVAVKAVDDLNMLRAVKQRRSATMTIGRLARRDIEGLEGIELIQPGDVAAYRARAQELLAPVLEFYAHNPDMATFVDVVELANEPDPPALAGEIAAWVAGGGVAWQAPAITGYGNMGRIFVEAVRLGRELIPGVAWGIGSFNAGTPEHGEMEAFIASGILEVAAERHDVVLMAHAGALGTDPIDIGYGQIIPGAPYVPAGGGQMVGRTAYLAELAGELMLPTVISEAYYGGGYTSTADIVDRAAWMDAWAAARGWVVAVLPFTHSPVAGWRGQDYTPHYPALINQVALPASGRLNAAPGAPGTPPPGSGAGDPPRVDYARIYVLLAPDADAAMAAAAVRGSFDAARWTVGASADDAGAGQNSRRRVIAVNPAAWGGGSDGTGLAGFFRRYYPGATYEELVASSPVVLEAKIRALATGKPADPIYRPVRFDAWPTEDRVITQAFGANPDYYAQFGLAGHEGVDLRAIIGSRIMAAVAGVVVRVGDDELPAAQGGHNYGRRIYVQSVIDGIQHTLVYAHLLERLVDVGDQVAAGQIIGRADTTGNAQGSHLHMTVYQEGAQWPGYPAGIIDPMIGLQHLLAPPPVADVAVGLHASADPAFAPDDIDKMIASGADVVKLLSFHDPNQVALLASRMPAGSTYIIRAFLSMPASGGAITPAQFAERTLPDVRRTISRIIDGAAGKLVRILLEIHNEPNLVQEGLGASWADGAAFGSWMANVLELYEADPDVNRRPYLVPGLSPGGAVAGVRADSLAFLRDCLARLAAVQAPVYGVAVHNYWSAAWPMSQALAQLQAVYQIAGRRRYFVTEASNNKGDTSASDKVRQYRAYPAQAAAALPGLEAITYYVASASNPAWHWPTASNPEGSGEVITLEMARQLGGA